MLMVNPKHSVALKQTKHAEMVQTMVSNAYTIIQIMSNKKIQLVLNAIYVRKVSNINLSSLNTEKVSIQKQFCCAKTLRKERNAILVSNVVLTIC